MEVQHLGTAMSPQRLGAVEAGKTLVYWLGGQLSLTREERDDLRRHFADWLQEDELRDDLLKALHGNDGHEDCGEECPCFERGVEAGRA